VTARKTSAYKLANQGYKLAKALAFLRDPSGDGSTKVSHGWSGQPMICVRCKLPTVEQKEGIVVPSGPRCAC
jgi:hypothetical protein